ncbi:cytochrome d ubiquinol oxidase subunit II [Myxococcus stipitatus DSM 14675]|uniref:Cytochrome d ubiquinol oxidase subunit II n=1 Tax=Myxococcus stipitatus (strain DSM 14675 / JCM 12634 / Mx s8) TaxID=1278073 RepID=L7UII6_MYXSD|nr:cytochrome d ubiquinol oxidase subunit II [Myxococcus stipitatus]AGC48781.1 cytochrome d ubiquinol oxidase subunit II [Myxococcus stipitatus DSM 14675]
MSTEAMLGFVMAGAFVLYALFGGADFGGGVWDLFASGPRKAEQRTLIARAMGPVWEVNHVWLIVGMVLMFAGFPRAFAALSVALHVPLTLLMLGIVFRGAAFTFRAYDLRGYAAERQWGLVFSIASVVAPLLLGMCVGAVASGDIRVEGRVVVSGFFASWLSPFAWAVGVLALTLFAFLAAVYLTHEAHSEGLREDFRRRALGAGVAVFLAALVVLLLARGGAPRVWEGLLRSPFALALHGATAVAAVTAFALLWTRRFQWARLAAAFQAGLIVLGWAASQYPYLVVPDITLSSAASSASTQRVLLVAVVIGALTVVPSIALLFRVFRPRPEGNSTPGSHG